MIRASRAARVSPQVRNGRSPGRARSRPVVFESQRGAHPGPAMAVGECPAGTRYDVPTAGMTPRLKMNVGRSYHRTWLISAVLRSYAGDPAIRDRWDSATGGTRDRKAPATGGTSRPAGPPAGPHNNRGRHSTQVARPAIPAPQPGNQSGQPAVEPISKVERAPLRSIDTVGGRRHPGGQTTEELPRGQAAFASSATCLRAVQSGPREPIDPPSDSRRESAGGLHVACRRYRSRYHQLSRFRS
jgi:hypothetical protein